MNRIIRSAALACVLFLGGLSARGSVVTLYTTITNQPGNGDTNAVSTYLTNNMVLTWTNGVATNPWNVQIGVTVAQSMTNEYRWFSTNYGTGTWLSRGIVATTPTNTFALSSLNPITNAVSAGSATNWFVTNAPPFVNTMYGQVEFPDGSIQSTASSGGIANVVTNAFVPGLSLLGGAGVTGGLTADVNTLGGVTIQTNLYFSGPAGVVISNALGGIGSGGLFADTNGNVSLSPQNAASPVIDYQPNFFGWGFTNVFGTGYLATWTNLGAVAFANSGVEIFQMSGVSIGANVTASLFDPSNLVFNANNSGGVSLAGKPNLSPIVGQVEIASIIQDKNLTTNSLGLTKITTETSFGGPSGLSGLRIDKYATNVLPSGISYSIGGIEEWTAGIDVSNLDFVPVNIDLTNAFYGNGDMFRISPYPRRVVLGPLAISGRGGSPSNEPSFFTVLEGWDADTRQGVRIAPLYGNPATNDALVFERNYNSDSQWMLFTQGNTTQDWRIGQRQHGSIGGLSIFNANGSVSSPTNPGTEILTFQNGGNIGFGVTNPAFRIDSGDSARILANTSLGGLSGVGGIQVNRASTNPIPSGFSFAVDGVEQWVEGVDYQNGYFALLFTANTNIYGSGNMISAQAYPRRLAIGPSVASPTNYGNAFMTIVEPTTLDADTFQELLFYPLGANQINADAITFVHNSVNDNQWINWSQGNTAEDWRIGRTVHAGSYDFSFFNGNGSATSSTNAGTEVLRISQGGALNGNGVGLTNIPTTSLIANTPQMFITAFGSRCTNLVQVSSLLMSVQVVDAATGTPITFVKIEDSGANGPAGSTNTWPFTFPGGISSTFTNTISIPKLGPGAVVTVTDASTGTGASTAIVASRLY